MEDALAVSSPAVHAEIDAVQVENIVAHIVADTEVTEATATAVVAEAEARTAIAEAVIEQIETPAAAPTAERDDVAWLTDRLDFQDREVANLKQLLEAVSASLLLLPTILEKLNTPQQTVVISSPPSPLNEPPNPSPQSVSEGDPQAAQPNQNANPPAVKKRRKI